MAASPEAVATRRPFSLAYADQAEQDHAALKAAVSAEMRLDIPAGAADRFERVGPSRRVYFFEYHGGERDVIRRGEVILR